MEFPLYYLLIPYLIILLFFAIFSFFNLYHLFRYGLAGPTTIFIGFLYLVLTAFILYLSWRHLGLINWLELYAL